MPRKRKENPRSEQREREQTTGRFAYEGLDRVMHEKARLGILASLAAKPDGVTFNDLKQLCGLTDGNLSRHLAVLNEAQMVEIWKSSSSSRSQTLCRLTEQGRTRFNAYIAVLEQVIRDAQSHPSRQTAIPPARLSGGWSLS